MVKRRNLNQAPEKTLADIIAALKNKADQGKTVPHGVKDLGAQGDLVWDGVEGRRSVRDAEKDLAAVNVRLEEAQAKIVQAAQDLETLETTTLPGAVAELKQADVEARVALADAVVKISEARQVADEVAAGLDTLESETLPGEVARLEAADRVARSDLSELDGRLEDTKTALEATKASVETLGSVTLPNAVARLEAADRAAQTTLAELDDRLGSFAPTADVEALRAQLTQAQEAVEQAQETADAATTAASSANRAALKAAGIAEAKGRVIYSETAPGVGDQSTSNLWIRPSTEQTFVWSGSEWEEIESEALQQAAQDALDAKAAAQQAQSDADEARALAQSAQAAAQAAQATADQATLDARDAHNQAVTAQDAAQEAASKAEVVATSGGNLVVNGMMTTDDYWPYFPFSTGGPNSIRFFTTPAGQRTHSKPFTGPSFAVQPGAKLLFRAWVKADKPGSLLFVELRDQGGVGDHALEETYPIENYTVPVEWTLVEKIVTVKQTAVSPLNLDAFYFNHPNGAETGAAISMGGIQLYILSAEALQALADARAAQTTADQAQARADSAYQLAESRPDSAEVQALADAAEVAAKRAAALDAQAKADRAKADALKQAAVDAQAKADAARAAAEDRAGDLADAAEEAAKAAAAADATAKAKAAQAAAAADAKSKADKALADALAALQAARGEITAQITASANGKNAITVSTGAPSGSGVVAGDTWWRVDSGGTIFGQWTWTGTAWAPRMVDSEVIANLDVHKLTVTGDARIAEAVINKLWVDGFAAKTATFQNVTIGSGDMFPDLQAALDSTDPDATAPFVQFGLRADDPSIWVEAPYKDAKKIDAPIIVKPGGKYRFTLTTRATNQGVVFFVDFVTIVDGEDVGYTWADATPITGTTTSTTRYPVSGQSIARAFVWETHTIELTASAGATLYPRFWLIHPNGSQDAGHQWVKDVSFKPMTGGELIVNGAVTAEKITASEELSAKVGQFLTVEADQIIAGTGEFDDAVVNKLWVEGIAAKAITSSRVTVSPGDLVPDLGTAITAGNGEERQLWLDAGFGINSTNQSFWVAAPYSGYHILDHPIPVKAGQKYVFEVVTMATNPGVKWYVDTVQYGTIDRFSWSGVKPSTDGTPADNTYIINNGTIKSANTWETHRVQLTAPRDGVISLRFWPIHTKGSQDEGYQWFKNLSFKPMTGAVLIEDGAITTPKLNVTQDMAARVVSAMSVAAKRLVVTGDTILANATVINDLAAKVVSAARIYASQLVVAALDEDGNLNPDSVNAVNIADGAVTAPKITVTEQLAANIVDAMAVNTKQLIVTDGVTPENAAHVGGVLIDNQGLVVTGEDARVTLDESGLTQYVHDEDNPETWVPSVQLGVDGTSENVFEAGQTGISRSAVVSPAGSFDTLTVGGSNILDLLDALPKGEVYRYEATEDSIWHGSDKEAYRVQVSAYLQPGRIYRVEVPSHFVQRRTATSGTGYLLERIRYDFPDRTSAVSSSSPTVAQSRHAIPATTLPVTIGGQSGFLRTDDWTAPRWTWVILCVESVGGMDYKHIATASYPLVLSIQDIGASSRMSGRNWMPTGIPTTPTNTPAPAPKPAVVRRTTTWGNGGYGGDTGSGQVYQGTYPPYGNRYGGWLFPSALKTAVKGAKIEKFEIYLVNAHWYYGSGGTASITPLRSGYKDMPWYSGTNLRVPGWPRYQARWVTLPASWYPYIANGTYGGMGVRAPDGFEFYGRWQGTATKFRATYVK